MRLVLEGDKRRPLMDEFQSVVSISFSSSSSLGERERVHTHAPQARFVSNPRAFWGRQTRVSGFSVETRVTILIYRKKTYVASARKPLARAFQFKRWIG